MGPYDNVNDLLDDAANDFGVDPQDLGSQGGSQSTFWSDLGNLASDALNGALGSLFPSNTPPPSGTPAKKDYTPWVFGGLAVVAIIVVIYAMRKK